MLDVGVRGDSGGFVLSWSHRSQADPKAVRRRHAARYQSPARAGLWSYSSVSTGSVFATRPTSRYSVNRKATRLLTWLATLVLRPIAGTTLKRSTGGLEPPVLPVLFAVDGSTAPTQPRGSRPRRSPRPPRQVDAESHIARRCSRQQCPRGIVDTEGSAEWRARFTASSRAIPSAARFLVQPRKTRRSSPRHVAAFGSTVGWPLGSRL
ncbi:MAG: hypothetical protein QOF33_1726 [Thermomicrobiales bacterium]|jgi:hypothetical protein|nr:hypothetical protein [Thermomicrobiales bacterium]